MTRPTASIVTVGSELTEGLRLDTNTREIAFALSTSGYHVLETASVGDHTEILADVLARLSARDALVVVTGGLGPTHDDITREAASQALRRPLLRAPELVELLLPATRRHSDERAMEQVLRQAELLEGADVILPVTGTAPGQFVATPAGLLVLLPGPPAEMRPMLSRLVTDIAPGPSRASVRELGCVGLTESDAQVRATAALSAHPGVAFTVLASPGDVHILLLDDGAGERALDAAAEAVTVALGARIYSTDGSTLAEAVVRSAIERGITLGLAESCTGGLVAARLTDVPGSSATFLGGVVAYSNGAKFALLGVSTETLARHGAVSAETAEEMAAGARTALGADIAVAVTGVAGPSGGSPDKPVGLVWFGLATASGTTSFSRGIPGDRAAVRIRAASTALDTLRREVLGL
jgi:nicotinamide-nucleotide amidase